MAVTPIPLTDQEKGILAAEWTTLVSEYSAYQPDEHISAIFQRNQAFVFDMAGIAKATFKGQSFNGIDAQGGFGWSVLRPEHLLRTSTGTTSGTTSSATGGADWTRAIAAPGWNFFIGTTTVNNQVSRRAFLILLGIVNHSPSPKSVGAQLKISGVTYPAWDIYWPMRGKQLYTAWAIPKPKALQPLDIFTLQMKDIATGADEPQIIGITYAEAGYLQLQNPTLESP